MQPGNQLKNLIDKYLKGESSQNEKNLLEHFYLNQLKKKEMPDTHTRPELKAEIWAAIFEELDSKEIKPVRRIWPGLRIAAAILLVSATSLLLYRGLNRSETTKDFVQHQILPGGNKAILTFADGRQISLTDASKGDLLKQQGITVTKTADGKLSYKVSSADGSLSGSNTINTPRGGQWQVTLPDGTNVWLNAASSLTYPQSFAKKVTRQVELKGEAYFEVAKDERHPFIVKTEDQEVKVLGTHFNINAYSDEKRVLTTLLEGAVQVKGAGMERVLKPGQQSRFSGSQLSVVKADIDVEMAWKEGKFVFPGEDITTIMRSISRWYNVDIEYKGAVTTEEFQVQISRKKDIKEVLELLELTEAVHFKIEGRKIIVTK